MSAAAIGLPETDGCRSLRLALEDSVRMGRAVGEIPLRQEEPPMPGDKPEVRLAGDDLDILRDEMRAAALQGAKSAVEEMFTKDRAKELFKVFFDVLREEMRAGAGDWVLGRAWWFVKLVGGLALLCLILLVVGGPGLLKSMFGLLWDHIFGHV